MKVHLKTIYRIFRFYAGVGAASNTASAAGLANTAYTPNGTTGMAYTVAKNGVTLGSRIVTAPDAFC